MKTAQIRENFLKFFAEKAHQRVDSSPLVPANDQTLLFTNSGMVQFKDVFLGFDKRPYDKAATVQRCLRAGGKHNDLENVGYTARHHTFFEMLGNFSFGDYFKEKAVPYAWEFLTSPKWLGLKKEHLWVTVYGGGAPFGKDGGDVPADEEAARLWEKTLVAAGFGEAEAKRRILRVPTTDNFWMMGDTGPCGPCSEIFYDRDPAAKTFRGDSDADDCVEIWNLVFMQYNRSADGKLQNLPAPCVDTGMGLERIAAVMQNVAGNYEADLFTDLQNNIAKTVNAKTDAPPASLRVIADHLRAAAFMLADGIFPGNEGRGYVLRRIIRRALRHLQNIRGNNAMFADLAPHLTAAMGGAYPLLKEKQKEIAAALRAEEEGFATMLQKGTAILAEEIAALQKAGGKVLPGEAVFRLYDTYGFPPDLTAAIARDDYGVAVDEAGFDAEMKKQRSRSRAAQKFGAGQAVVQYNGAATEFSGYKNLQDEGEIAALILPDGGEQKEIREGEKCLIVLNKTPFYAESGGQIGDSGFIKTATAAAQITDTKKIRADVWAHFAEVTQGALRPGDAALCEVDAPRRAAICRGHSAAHLMHAALRLRLGTHVQQRGSMVSQNAVRFDFSHNAAVSAEELRDVERIVNEQISANAAVQTKEMPYADALKTGAMALFGEKYGDRVRVVFIDEKFSVELCGGTHAARAGDLGFFMFSGESAIAAGVRRVEALTTAAAVARAQDAAARLDALAAMAGAPNAQLEGKLEQLQKSLKEKTKQLEEMQAARAKQIQSELAAAAEERGGIRHIIAPVPNADGKTLRTLAMSLARDLSPAAVFLAAADGGKAFFAAAATEKTINANEWLKAAAATADAKGGGKPDFAQAGGGNPEKIPAALTAAKNFLN